MTSEEAYVKARTNLGDSTMSEAQRSAFHHRWLNLSGHLAVAEATDRQTDALIEIAVAENQAKCTVAEAIDRQTDELSSVLANLQSEGFNVNTRPE